MVYCIWQSNFFIVASPAIVCPTIFFFIYLRVFREFYVFLHLKWTER